MVSLTIGYGRSDVFHLAMYAQQAIAHLQIILTKAWCQVICLLMPSPITPAACGGSHGPSYSVENRKSRQCGAFELFLPQYAPSEAAFCGASC